MLFLILLRIIPIVLGEADYGDLTTENKDDIEEHQRFFDDVVKVDLKKLKNKINNLVDLTNSAFSGLKTYIDTSLQELNNHTEKEILKMHDLVVTNMNKLSNATADQRDGIISWTHTRDHLHEDVLKTGLAICAYNHAQYGEGVVNFASEDGGYIDNHYSWRLFNRTCSDADCAKEVLDRDTGKFTVPPNAAGVYMFTFSVIMDPWDTSLKPSVYVFRKNEEPIAGTGVTAELSNQDSRIPGSRTIFLKLRVSDQVDVFQTNPDSDSLDEALSFCVTLVNLDMVRKSPTICLPD